MPLTLTFMEAVKGTTKYVQVNRVINCNTCQGSGLKPGKSKNTCRTCHGTGLQTIMMGGGFGMQTTCQTCGGEGFSIPSGYGCSACNSTGKIKERKAVQVTVPPGVDQNSRIKVPGEGDAPLKGNGPNGDLFIMLNVKGLFYRFLSLLIYFLCCFIDSTIKDLSQTEYRYLCGCKNSFL